MRNGFLDFIRQSINDYAHRIFAIVFFFCFPNYLYTLN